MQKLCIWLHGHLIKLPFFWRRPGVKPVLYIFSLINSLLRCLWALSYCDPVYLYLKHISNVIYWAKTLRKCEVDDKKLLYQLNRHLQCRGMKKTDSCVARKTLNTLWAQFQLTSSSNRVSFQPSYLNVGSSNSSRFYRMMPLLACPWRFLLVVHFAFFGSEQNLKPGNHAIMEF